MEEDALYYDVVIVGGGPAGLAASIRLKQLANEKKQTLNICLLEKAGRLGDHILSGAVLEPRALDELIPDWRAQNFPIKSHATEDNFFYLTEKKAWRLPTPPQMQNPQYPIISLGLVCRWLGEIAEKMGVDIFPGFPGQHLLFDQHNQVVGVKTGDVGLDKAGNETANYQPGVPIYGKQTILAEGCRGSLAEKAMQHYHLRANCAPQTYGLGVKEIWRVESSCYKPGKVDHTVGWPLDHKTYGGSFIYHWDDNHVALGFVVGLDYENPTLSPFHEMQRFKTHPKIAPLLKGGERIAYGARALNEGGIQSIPKCTYPGGILIGDAAGFLNTPKIKGIHTAMKSGMIGAEAVFDALNADANEATHFQSRLENSWVWQELTLARNIRPGFRLGLWGGLVNAALETYIFRGHAPWTLQHKTDHLALKEKDKIKPIVYPDPDNLLTFDKLSSVFLSNTQHEENQPCHLILKTPEKAIDVNWTLYGSPEQYYCPANVYEIVYNESEEGKVARLQINASNCVHCKTCDIKDPTQNIEWVPPQGGGGPRYGEM